MSPQSLVGERTSSRDWHFRLGPFQATTHTINHFQPPLISKNKLPFCTAYSQVKTHALPRPSSPSRSNVSFDLLFLDV